MRYPSRKGVGHSFQEIVSINEKNVFHLGCWRSNRLKSSQYGGVQRGAPEGGTTEDASPLVALRHKEWFVKVKPWREERSGRNYLHSNTHNDLKTSQVSAQHSVSKKAQFTRKTASFSKKCSSPYYPLTRSAKGQKVVFFLRKWEWKVSVLWVKSLSVQKYKVGVHFWGLWVGGQHWGVLRCVMRSRSCDDPPF